MQIAAEVTTQNTEHRNDTNVTYLHLAAGTKDLAIFNEIIDLNAVDINSIDNQSETSLFYAVRLENGCATQQLI